MINKEKQTQMNIETTGKFMRSCAALLLFTTAFPSVAGAALSKVEIAERLKASAVTIRTLNGVSEDGTPIGGSGSGFHIGGGYVVTNHHVIDGAKIAVVNRTSDTREHAVRKIAAMGHSSTIDIAILVVDGFENVPALPITSSATLRQGADLFHIGNPLGEYEGTFATGVVSNTKDRNAPSPRIQYTIPTSHGTSGGPVVNDECQVVAVNAAGETSTIDLVRNAEALKRGSTSLQVTTDAQNVNWGVPSDYLIAMLRDAKISDPRIKIVAANTAGGTQPATGAAANAQAVVSKELPVPPPPNAPDPALAFFTPDIKRFIENGGAPAEFTEFKRLDAEMANIKKAKRALEEDGVTPLEEKERPLVEFREKLVKLAFQKLKIAKKITSAYKAGARIEIVESAPEEIVPPAPAATTAPPPTPPAAPTPAAPPQPRRALDDF